jgi:hypothetical protein
MAVVDQLETNRQRRRFAEEEMSETRKLWARRDELWAETQLQKKQAKYAQLFSSTMQNVMEEVKVKMDTQVELAEKAKANGNMEEYNKRMADVQRQATYWRSPNPVIDGKLAGEAMLVQETVRRMQQQDSSFGEFVMLQAGRDPGAGSLVDSQNPVQSLLVAPGESNPTGEVALAAELNRTDGGTGGMTEGRTDRPGDPIDFIPVNAALAHKVFGESYATNKYQEMRLLRGIVGDDVDGSGRTDPSRPVTGPSTGGATGGATDESVQTTPPGTEEIASPTADDESQSLAVAANSRASGGRSSLPPVQTSNLDLDNRLAAQGDRGPAIDTTPNPTGGSQGRNPSYESRGYLSRLARAVGEMEGVGSTEPDPLSQSFIMGGNNDFIRSPQRERPDLNSRANLQRDRTGGLSTPAEESPAPENEVPTTASELDVPPGEISRAAQGDEAAQSRVRAPSTNAGAQQAARTVMQPTRGRPNFVQLYNAVGLKHLGVIDGTELRRYAQTGSFDEAAKWKVQAMGNGAALVYNEDDARQNYMIQAPPGPMSAADRSKAANDYLTRVGKIKDLIREDVEDEFQYQDEDGEWHLDAGPAAKLKNILEEQFAAYGVDQGDPTRIGDININDMAKGGRMIANYDESDIFFWNWPFNDDVNKPAMTAYNVMLGAQLSRAGLRQEAEVTQALHTYLKTLSPRVRQGLGMDMSDNGDHQSLGFVYAIERQVAAAKNGQAVGPKGHERKYRGDKDAIRKALLSDYIRIKLGQGE